MPFLIDLKNKPYYSNNMQTQTLENQKALTPLWIMLNQLNLKTNTYPGEVLSPFVYPKRKLLSVMQAVYLDAHLLNIKSPQVDFLEQTLKEIYPFKKDYDFSNQYWFEDATAAEEADRAAIKQIILKAHLTAVVL